MVGLDAYFFVASVILPSSRERRLALGGSGGHECYCALYPAQMDTSTAPKPITAAPLPADDPRSPENIARRKALSIAERDASGRLYPGSVLTRAGRPPGATITTLARTHTDAAINLLAAAVDDEKAPMAARVTAAQALLDRGWGKAPIQIDLNVRAKFDDFLREVGAAATYEHEHPDSDAVLDEAEGQGQPISS